MTARKAKIKFPKYQIETNTEDFGKAEKTARVFP